MKKILIIIGLMLLFAIVIIVSIIRSDTIEEKVRRKYNFKNVEINTVSKNKRIELYLYLKPDDVKRYCGTVEGEEYMDVVIPKIIIEINDNNNMRDLILKIAKQNEFAHFDIIIHVMEPDYLTSSARPEYVGRYESDVYSVEEWFTEGNKEVQKWKKHFGRYGYSYENEEEYVLPELRKKVVE